jgi:hypothetical protein
MKKQYRSYINDELKPYWDEDGNKIECN